MDGQLTKTRVLVADDDPNMRRMLSRMVEHWGYEPVVAEDGNAALAALSGSNPPERALLDWMMPGLSGPDVCRVARAKGSRAHIVMLTARDRPECVIEGLEAGADDYVVKPFDTGILRARLLRGVGAPQAKPAPEEVRSGMVIAGRFRLEQQIGEGGMGTVHRAVHLELGHAVAVKLVRPSLASSPLLRARFETEARAMSLLRSPHVAQVFDYGFTPGGIPYLIMEYLRGQTLGQLLADRGRLSLSIVSRIVTELARGLAVAHEAGVVHRDVKPENVFLEDIVDDSVIGLPFRAKLLDFGLARLLEGEAPALRTTGHGRFVGTLGFAAPEQLDGGPIGPRTDLWSLGATAFCAATGTAAIAEGPDATMAFLTAQCAIPVPSEIVAGLPPAFDAWMLKACARDPADRFQDASSMARALRAVVLPS
ncbi:MAG: protein kinase [Sandaracinaceae bacterium]|jgi:serine/threonine-protein kinase|nr:protein kinase [Sandaracinaceae bacterium]